MSMWSGLLFVNMVQDILCEYQYQYRICIITHNLVQVETEKKKIAMFSE